MAVTKAQLVVWAVIAGLGVCGCSALSRVTLRNEAVASSAMAAVMTDASATTARVSGPMASAETLPATIPEFPFPDDLAAATIGLTDSLAPGTVSGFVEITSDAIPEIATVSDAEIAATLPEGEPSVEQRMIVAGPEEPPIPMPGRPVVAQPVKAMPLAEVKTLYVVADTLNVRAAPTTAGTVLQKLPQGFAVAAREQSNEWVGFLMRDGTTGWMRTDYLSDTMPPPIAASPVRVWTEPLNLMM